MKLSSRQFLNARDAGELKLAFVGMSNIGKSFVAKRLAKELKFNLTEVDKLIWKSLGFDSMDDFADWQGQPYEEDYAEREKELIRLEAIATQKAMNSVKKNAILDTTGSVIYVDPAVRRVLKEKFYVVHVKAEPSDMERLKWDYFDNPKPLIWGRHFRAQPDLSDRENIFECYPKLLMSRAKEYAAMADATLTSQFVMDPENTAEDILMALKPSR
jgi:shikimate kinase